MFKVGDIVKGKKNFARYIVTGIDTKPGKPVWRGISRNGWTQGGTIFGSENFEDYEVIGHFDLAPMYEALHETFREYYVKKYGEEKYENLDPDLK